MFEGHGVSKSNWPVELDMLVIGLGMAGVSGLITWFLFVGAGMYVFSPSSPTEYL